MPRVEGPCCSFCSPFGSMMAFESPVGKTAEGNVEGNMAGAPALERMGWPRGRRVEASVGIITWHSSPQCIYLYHTPCPVHRRDSQVCAVGGLVSALLATCYRGDSTAERAMCMLPLNQTCSF